jgi:uncharacterized protein (DUF58 family)
VVDIGPLRVVLRDAFGAVTVSRAHGASTRVWVYPRVHPLGAVPAGVTRSLDGRVDRVAHGSITFDTLREYVIGDELRRVHWRTSARVGELMVRENLDTSLPRLVVLLDDRSAAYPAGSAAYPAEGEAFEAACEAAASLVTAAARADLPLALTLVSGATTHTEGRRSADSRPHLDALAEAALTDAALDRAVTRLRLRPLGDTLIYLTGPGRPEDVAAVAEVRGVYPTMVVGALGATGPVASAAEGVLVLAASDGAGFAAAWDGVQQW